MGESIVDIIPKGLHANEHEDGGIDEIDVTDLSGELADSQPPKAHEASHITGSDLLDLNGQSFENLLINGDFELGNPPLSWALGGAAATVVRSVVQVRTGNYSALLTRNGNDCNINQDIVDFTRYRGRPVTCHVWLWTATANAARMYITDGVGASVSSFHTGGSGWELVSATLNVDAGAGILTVNLVIDNNDADVYFDGAILVEGELSPAFSPKPLELAIGDTQIHNGASPLAWTDLDIAAQLGIEIGSAMVILKVTEIANTSELIFAVRRNGDTDEFYTGLNTKQHVASTVVGQNSAWHGVVIAFTDENGVIEWFSSHNNNTTVDVMGYVKM